MRRFLARLAFLLRPGWIALILVVIAFTYLCFMVLAPWQLGKNARTSRENQQIEIFPQHRAGSAENLAATAGFVGSERAVARVTATGHYLPDVEVLARLRVVEGDQAFEVLAPFVVDDGPTVLVDRGYVRPGAGLPRPADRPPAAGNGNHHGAAARLRARRADKEPFSRDGFQQVYSINTEQVSALTKVPLAGSYLQLVENQPGGLGVIGVPHLDAGPFLSYGIQWISFGILAPIGLGYFAYSEIRARRQHKATGVVGRNPDDRRGETRRPLRPPAVECALRAFSSALTAGKPRLSRPTCTLNASSAHSITRPAAPRPPAPPATAPPRGAGRPPAGCRPSPRVGRICSSWWYCVGPPSRTPSAPAKAASTTPALGLG